MTKRRRTGIWTTIVLLFGVCGLDAMFIMYDLENVPIDRLITNLERLVAATPKDARLLVNLARTHAMAYALKVTTVEVRKGRESDGAWRGYGVETFRQFTGKPAVDAAERKAAAAQLASAVRRYEEALAITPADTVARLGLGWALDQSGNKEGAKAQYRAVVAASWPRDLQSGSRLEGFRFITEEAVFYLLPLLDPNRDRDEIATLKTYGNRLEALPRAITPIAIPLRDGLTIDDVRSTTTSVTFDADGSGFGRRWTWITNDAAWLVFDRRGTGRVTSALQLFGSVTFWLFWENGYDAMRSLDDNGDGRLSGAELAGLALWRDANANGISETGEVKPLADWHVVSLSCRFAIDAADADEIAFSPDGVTFSDGTTRPTWDVVLHRQRTGP